MLLIIHTATEELLSDMVLLISHTVTEELLSAMVLLIIHTVTVNQLSYMVSSLALHLIALLRESAPAAVSRSVFLPNRLHQLHPLSM